MRFDSETLIFWGAVLSAIALKILASSEKMHPRATAFTVGSGIFAAYFGTDFVVDYFNVTGTKNIALIAGGLAITGDAIMKNIIISGPAFAESIANRIHKAFGSDKND